MVGSEVATPPRRGIGSRFERTIWEEAVIVGLYTSVMQLSVLAGFDHDDFSEQVVVLIGTALGILCAHSFAVVLGRQYVAEDGPEPIGTHVPLLLGIVAGCGSVSLLALSPYVLFDGAEDPGSVAMFVLAVVIGYAGYSSARSAGRTRFRAWVVAGVMVAIALAVATVKAVLTH